MSSARKTAALFFLIALVFIPPLCADPVLEEPQALFDAEFETPSGDETEPFPDDNFLVSEETEPLPGGEPKALLSDETEPLLSVETESLPAAELEPLLSVETECLPGEETETLLSAETDPFADDESAYLFFAESDLVFSAEAVPTRSLDEIFPSLTRAQRRRVLTSAGLKFSFEKDGSPNLKPAGDSGIDLLGSVMEKKPSHIIEALVVVPYGGRELDMLDAYNALGRISNIKDHSVSVGGREINIFKETTRLENAKKIKAISDPPPAAILPLSETMYLRFEDAYFGDLFIRGDVSVSAYGITYNMTNFKTVRYFLLPIMKAETFSAIIYLEPVEEGILVYSMSGIYIPGFVADKVNLTPNINIRISALINWIIDGLGKAEKAKMDQENEV